MANKENGHLRRDEKKEEKRLIVILEQAALETVTLGKVHELIDCDKHKGQIKNHGRIKDVSACRPDITHACLLDLMDSPLNRAGLLQVYIRTAKDVVIEINPQTRIPRTFERFRGLMAQLLHKFSIKAPDNQTLLKVISKPITNHLPRDCTKIAIGHDKEAERVKLSDLIPDDDDRPIVFVVGAMCPGEVDVNYTDRTVAISDYPLSAMITCAKLTTAFEEKWCKPTSTTISKAETKDSSSGETNTSLMDSRDIV